MSFTFRHAAYIYIFVKHRIHKYNIASHFRLTLHDTNMRSIVHSNVNFMEIRSVLGSKKTVRIYDAENVFTQQVIKF